MSTRGLRQILALLICTLTLGVSTPMQAQSAPDMAREIAPTGKLRVGLLMLSYFAVDDAAAGQPKGVMPDLGQELARRIGVPYKSVRIRNPGEMMEGFRSGKLDATFIGITADRAAVFDFGPVIIGLRTTFLVPASSPIKTIEEIDRAGVHIVVPQRSAQEEHLKKIISKATMIPVAVETPKPAMELLAAGQADAFSHVVPMLNPRGQACRDRASCRAATTMSRSRWDIRRVDPQLRSRSTKSSWRT